MREVHITEVPADLPDVEGRGVIEWREKQLLAAGFERALASRLAPDCAVDLHKLIELVEQGCPPRLAARILAPLDGERKPC